MMMAFNRKGGMKCVKKIYVMTKTLIKPDRIVAKLHSGRISGSGIDDHYFKNDFNDQGDPTMKNARTLLILISMIVLIIISVSADSNSTTDSTVVPTGNATTVMLPTTTAIINPVNTTPALILTNATVVPTATNNPVLNTSANATSANAATMNPIPAESPDNQPSTGNITAVSSPLGASILIDGVFSGYTPGKITGFPGGNHIVRLTMSGYYDYEGTIYIIPGQVTSVFGTLNPVNGYSVPSSPAPVTTSTAGLTPAAVQPTPASSPGPLENPTVIAAIIGTFSAVIGAVVAIFTHLSKMKKE
jgi:hypothetical protein